jgi:hypothetical protein
VNSLSIGACSRARLSPLPSARCFRLNRVHVPLHLTNKSNCCSDQINTDERIGVWKLKQTLSSILRRGNVPKTKTINLSPADFSDRTPIASLSRGVRGAVRKACLTQNRDHLIHTNFSKPHLILSLLRVKTRREV